MKGQDRNEERGSMAPFGIGLAVISLTLILIIGAASSMFIFQKRLTNYGENAVLFVTQFGEPVEVFVSRVGSQKFSSLSISSKELPDGNTVEVTVCARWAPPVPLVAALTEQRICSHATARAE